jgi:hypothetical protein
MIKKHWQILLAALLFLFSSCDQLLPPGGNGVDIPVKIRAVSIAGGAKIRGERVRSAGDFSAPRAPVELPRGGLRLTGAGLRLTGGALLAKECEELSEMALFFLPGSNYFCFCELTFLRRVFLLQAAQNRPNPVSFPTARSFSRVAIQIATVSGKR